MNGEICSKRICRFAALHLAS